MMCNNKSASGFVRRYTDYLFQIQNPDGGWGIEEGALSSPLNTSEVLLALRDEISRSTSQATKALKYLRTTQAPCGGWPSRRQFPEEKVTVTSTSFCVQVLISYDPTKQEKKAISKAIYWLMSFNNEDIWPNSSETQLSLTASALALQSIAISIDYLKLEKKSLTKIIRALENYQNNDGGFPNTPQSPSTVAASLQVLHALLLLHKHGFTINHDIIQRLRSYIECTDPTTIVQTEIQQNKVGNWTFQFEHFNSSWVLIVCGIHQNF